MTVESGQTLRLEPGTVVKVQPRSLELRIRGSLDARGTPDQPIVLTSWHDDRFGGDTNANGDTTRPSPDDWAGIRYAGDFDDPEASIDLNYVNHLFASGFRRDFDRALRWYGSFEVTNSNFAHGRTNDFLTDGSEATVLIEGNTFTVDEGTSDAAAYIDARTPPVVRNNHISGYTTSLEIHSEQLDLDLVTQNSSDTVPAGPVFVGGSLLEDSTWHAGPLPLGVGARNGRSTGRSLVIEEGVQLTIGPGTIVKSRQAGFIVRGSLTGIGRSDDPIVFTSWRDDRFGGDTNGDGDATEPRTQDWSGIFYSNTAEHPESTLQFFHTTFSFAKGIHPELQGQAVNWKNWYGSVHFQSSVFEAVDFTHLSTDRADAFNIAVANRVLEGGSGAPHGLRIVAAGSPIVQRNSFTGFDVPLNIHGGRLLLSRIEENDFTGSPNGRVLLGGTLAADGQLQALTIPYGLDSYRDWGWRNGPALRVPNETTLEIEAGTIFKSRSQSSLIVDGTVTTHGTPTEPVVFTSLSDDRYGGDTNGDGAASSVNSTQWRGVVADNGAVLAFDGVRIHGAQSGVRILEGSAVIRGAVSENERGVQACPVERNPDCGVDARYVDWGDPTGPAPLGNGDLVCGLVTVAPWSGGGADGFPLAPNNGCAATAESVWDSINEELSLLCGNDPAACNLINGYLDCHEQIAVTAIELGSGIDVTQLGTSTIETTTRTVLDIYVADALAEVPFGAGFSWSEVIGLGAGLADGVDTYITLTDTANRCIRDIDR